MFLQFLFNFRLDPTGDPLGVLLMIDYYALKSEQHEYVIRMFAEWEVSLSLALSLLSFNQDFSVLY